MRFITFLFNVNLFIAGFSQGNTEYIFSSSGGDYTSVSVQLSWTLGEPISGLLFSGNNSLTQGFHQSNNFFTALPDIDNFRDLVVYPNPTPGKLYVVSDDPSSNLYFSICSVWGVILSQNRLCPASLIDLTPYPPGVYYIRIYYHDQSAAGNIKVVKT